MPCRCSFRKKVAGRFIVSIVGIVTQRMDAVAERRLSSFRLWIVSSRVLSFPRSMDAENPDL
jgi:hypothetical protein